MCYTRLASLCWSLTKPPKVSGGVPHCKVRLSSMFTVSITRHYTSEQGTTSLRDCKKRMETYILLLLFYVTAFMHVLHIYMEAGKPAISLFKSLKAMCVI